MNVIDATRCWLRSDCPLIDAADRFNAGYLGAKATEYALSLSGEKHTANICGDDIATYTLLFSARLPCGQAVQPNIAAAEFFARLSAWLRGLARAGALPTLLDGYETKSLKVANSGQILAADGNTARYTLQMTLELQEVFS